MAELSEVREERKGRPVIVVKTSAFVLGAMGSCWVVLGAKGSYEYNHT